MARLVVLDATPVGLLCGPSGSREPERCRAWLRGRVAAGDLVLVPEIADYEVRRELVHRGFETSLANLDLLCDTFSYLAITTEAMRLAAEFWAALRRLGRPTADRHALDGDAILAAQARLAGGPDDEILVATSNVGHLARFGGIDARPWEAIG